MDVIDVVDVTNGDKDDEIEEDANDSAAPESTKDQTGQSRYLIGFLLPLLW